MMQRISMTSLSLFATVAMGSTAHADFGSDSWWKSFAVTGYVDAGIMGNTTGSTNGTNFGRLFDDRPNLAELNQASIVVTRPLDPNADDFDYGFTLQPMFGADARYTHLLGVMDHAISGVNQLTFIEADMLMHLPWTIGGGTDVKLGIFPSPLSAETTVPSNNPFYSHSYIFNFGVTVAHFGAFTVTHADPLIDVYLGIDAGNQATPWKDNNSSAAGWAGLGLNLAGGNLTITWLNHFGPENATGALNPSGDALIDGSWRSESTITTVWKYSSDLTLTTDLNFIRDVGINANGFGIAQYASYAIDSTYTLQARGEIWRDEKGAFVGAFPGMLDAVNALQARPNTSFTAVPFGQGVTYAALTLGVNIKENLPDPFGALLIRPEIRYDHATARPFDNFRSSHSFTIGTDFILSF
jgi:hypothetical protein